MVALLAQQLHVMAGARLLRRRGSRCSAAAAAEQLAQQPVPPPGCTLHTLPHGLSISHTASPAEVAFLYREQWVQQVYLQHGVCIRPGDVVLDVGANAGLFACFAAEVRCNAAQACMCARAQEHIDLHACLAACARRRPAPLAASSAWSRRQSQRQRWPQTCSNTLHGVRRSRGARCVREVAVLSALLPASLALT